MPWSPPPRSSTVTQPLTPERRVETMQGFYRRLTSALEDVLPLLGLVLFGDPEIARRFYRDSFSVAMDRLGVAWQEAGARYGSGPESTGRLGPRRDGHGPDRRPGAPSRRTSRS